MAAVGRHSPGGPQQRQLQQVLAAVLLAAMGVCAAVLILSARDLHRHPSALVQMGVGAEDDNDAALKMALGPDGDIDDDVKKETEEAVGKATEETQAGVDEEINAALADGEADGKAIYEADIAKYKGQEVCLFVLWRLLNRILVVHTRAGRLHLPVRVHGQHHLEQSLNNKRAMHYTRTGRHGPFGVGPELGEPDAEGRSTSRGLGKARQRQDAAAGGAAAANSQPPRCCLLGPAPPSLKFEGPSPGQRSICKGLCPLDIPFKRLHWSHADVCVARSRQPPTLRLHSLKLSARMPRKRKRAVKSYS
jgi:hypothetical protein